MNYRDKTKPELIKELQELQQEYYLLKEAYTNYITECKQKEESLKKSENHYRTLVNAIDEGFCIVEVIFDQNEKPVDYRFLEINPAFEKQTDLIDAKGKRMRELKPEHEKHWFEIYGKIAVTGQPLRFQNRARQLNRWYDVYAFRVGRPEDRQVAILFNDITRSKLMEEALMENAARLKVALSPIDIAVFNQDLNLRYTWIFKPQIGYTVEQVIGKTDAELLPPEAATKITKIKRRVLENGNVGRVEVEVAFEGRMITYDLVVEPLRNATGQIVGITGASLDITKHKLAEEALRESEERYRQLYEQAPLSYQSLDAKGCFIDVNQTWLDMMGYSRDQVIGHWFGDFLAPQEVDAFKQRFTSFKAKGQVHVNIEMVQSSGSKIIVHIDGRIGRDKHGLFKQTHCILHNITERKNMEKVLEMEKENFRHSLDDSPLGVRITTIEGNTIYANKTLLNFYGYDSLGELQKTPLEDRYTPESYVQALERRRQREHGDLSATDYEISIVRKNGEIRHIQVFRKEVLWNGKRQFQIICNDITERKQVEEKLVKSENLLRTVLANAPISMFATDDKGVILLHDGKVLEKVGMKPGENVGVSIYDLFSDLKVVEHNGKVTSGESVLNRVLNGKSLSGYTEINGIYFDNQFVPFFDINKHVTGFIGVATDITTSKKIEVELQNSKELLEKLNQHLHDVRENERAFISREIHDELGQSMTALKLDLNMMNKYVGTNPEAVMKLRSMIELVSETIKDVQRISSDLRPGILDELGLVSAIEWYCEEFEERTGIKCNLELGNPDLNDSKMSLTFFRVLQEALTNVIRHAKASSVNVKLKKSLKGTTLTIHDNGIGITKEQIESNKSLGLISMNERVRQFNGTIVTSSKKGAGTKLTIFIPS